MRLALGGRDLALDPSGAVIWPARGLVIIADLHLEKGRAFARRGSFLPPYDTEVTLCRLEALLDRLRPTTVVSLGDAFHDRTGPTTLSPALADRLARLVHGTCWVWITGNHDPAIPTELGGACLPHLELDGLRLVHVPTGHTGELAGHLHPKARIAGRRLRLSRPCFVSDGTRLVLPAFGAYTGGINALSPTVTRLFEGGFAAYLTGDRRIFRVPHDCLLPEADPLRHSLDSRA